MNVLVDAGTGNASEVGAEIEALRLHRFFDRLHHERGSGHHVGMFFLRKAAELPGVRVRDDEHVPAVVGIQIHHHKTKFPTEKDETARIILAFCRAAKQASLVFSFL